MWVRIIRVRDHIFCSLFFLYIYCAEYQFLWLKLGLLSSIPHLISYHFSVPYATFDNCATTLVKIYSDRAAMTAIVERWQRSWRDCAYRGAI